MSVEELLPCKLTPRTALVAETLTRIANTPTTEYIEQWHRDLAGGHHAHRRDGRVQARRIRSGRSAGIGRRRAEGLRRRGRIQARDARRDASRSPGHHGTRSRIFSRAEELLFDLDDLTEGRRDLARR